MTPLGEDATQRFLLINYLEMQLKTGVFVRRVRCSEKEVTKQPTQEMV